MLYSRDCDKSLTSINSCRGSAVDGEMAIVRVLLIYADENEIIRVHVDGCVNSTGILVSFELSVCQNTYYI